MNITDARLKELGLEGFGSTVKLSCEDHSGHNKVFIHQWDGTKWVKASDWISPQKDIVRPMLEAAAADYSKSNAGWPQRTEACEKGS